MKVLIETYRGWDVFFNTDTENFYCHSEQFDTEKTKISYAAIKKHIDDYIKANYNFKKVKATHTSGNAFADYREITIIGLRKDGRFMYESKGVKKQLSEWDEKKYIIYNPDNEPIYAAIDATKREINALYKKQKQLEDSITGVYLADYKKTL